MAEIEDVVGEIDQLEKAISGLNQYRETLTKAISEMGETITNLGDRIKTLEQENGITEQLKNQLSALSTQVNEIDNDAKNALNRVDAIAGGVSKVEERLEAEAKNITDMATTLIEQSKKSEEAISFKRALQGVLKELMK